MMSLDILRKANGTTAALLEKTSLASSGIGAALKLVDHPAARLCSIAGSTLSGVKSGLGILRTKAAQALMNASPLLKKGVALGTGCVALGALALGSYHYDQLADVYEKALIGWTGYLMCHNAKEIFTELKELKKYSKTTPDSPSSIYLHPAMRNIISATTLFATRGAFIANKECYAAYRCFMGSLGYLVNIDQKWKRISSSFNNGAVTKI